MRRGVSGGTGLLDGSQKILLGKTTLTSYASPNVATPLPFGGAGGIAKAQISYRHRTQPLSVQVTGDLPAALLGGGAPRILRHCSIQSLSQRLHFPILLFLKFAFIVLTGSTLPQWFCAALTMNYWPIAVASCTARFREPRAPCGRPPRGRGQARVQEAMFCC